MAVSSQSTGVSTAHYLLDQARRRLTPTVNTIPGMGLIEKRLLTVDWKQKPLALPPPGSGLAPVMGDSGLPIVGHLIELFRGGPDFVMHLYRTHGPLFFADSPIVPSIVATGPEVTQTIYINRNKDFSQKGWHPLIAPFFTRGLMLLDFDEHMYHRRIMQEAFTRTRLAGYVQHVDEVVSAMITAWPTDNPRFLVHPAMKELTLDIASMVFMGHQPGTDRELVTKVNRAFTTTTRAGGAIVHLAVPPFKWWRGLRARRLLEEYFTERVAERRYAGGTDMLTVLCHAEDED
ncbi:MAG TPA: cytochrome P450, partial [Mycobacterium sp.]|nr:cytochrome P450 [Mycobacterium sp.]